MTQLNVKRREKKKLVWYSNMLQVTRFTEAEENKHCCVDHERHHIEEERHM